MSTIEIYNESQASQNMNIKFTPLFIVILILYMKICLNKRYFNKTESLIIENKSLK